jgi:hypothetical protein
MRKLLAALIFVPAIAQAQAALGIGDFLSRARESDSARTKLNATFRFDTSAARVLSATDSAKARFITATFANRLANSCSASTPSPAPEWMSQFGASVAHDRASLTTRVVDIPLRAGVFFQHFSVSTNQVRTDAADPDKSLQTLLRQKISDAQALADNGGAYAGHVAAQKLFNCGDFAQTFLSFATGYGKLDAPGNDESGRYAGNVTGQWFNRFVLGQKPGDLELIIGGRGTGLIGGKTLITGTNVRRALLAEGYTVLKVFNANALTITYTGAPGQPKINKYFSKFAIGLNASR